MEKGIKKQLEEMGSRYSVKEIEEARTMLHKAKNYVLSRSKLGLVNRADVINYLIDESISNGELRNVTDEERNLFVNAFSKDQFFFSG